MAKVKSNADILFTTIAKNRGGEQEETGRKGLVQLIQSIPTYSSVGQSFPTRSCLFQPFQG